MRIAECRRAAKATFAAARSVHCSRGPGTGGDAVYRRRLCHPAPRRGSQLAVAAVVDFDGGTATRKLWRGDLDGRREFACPVDPLYMACVCGASASSISNAAPGSDDSHVRAAGFRLSRAHSAKRHRMTTRIDRRFEKLKAEGRPALVTYFMGGDPDYDTSLQHHAGAAQGRRRRHRARHAVFRPDGRRPGDPGGGPARAEGRADAEEDAGHGRANSARRQRNADRPDGLLQPDLRLRRRPLPGGRDRQPASTG